MKDFYNLLIVNVFKQILYFNKKQSKKNVNLLFCR